MQLSKVGKNLFWICVGVVLVVAVLGHLHQLAWLSLLIFSVSLAVAVVPESMPAIVTVALALGARRMAALHAHVRKLASVETLGSVSVICTDKTGTLTTGKMRLKAIRAHDSPILLAAAAACCDATLNEKIEDSTGDPTEIAILLAAKKEGVDRSTIEFKNPRISTFPFDTTRKRMSVFRRDGNLFVKGAFEYMTPLCQMSESELHEMSGANNEFAAEGLRVLAVAMGHGVEENYLQFLGLIAIADPPRAEAITAIALARHAGIKIVMITGDQLATALSIAREIGMLRNGESGEALVHARATPEDKLEIIKSWKQKGAVVAMIGDGVNDAPALREANIGIAMGISGTEVTRQAADLVLGDDNFATLLTAVKEGRGIYQNVRSTIVFLLAGNFGELTVVFAASCLSLPLPFLASHLLWINLVTDSLPALALITEPVSDDVMNSPPRASNESLLGAPEWTWIGWVGGLEGGVVLTLFFVTLQAQGFPKARSLAFTTLVLSQLWRSFSARSRVHRIARKNVFSNRWLLATIGLTAATQVAIHFVPFTQTLFGITSLDLADFVKVSFCSIITVSIIEFRKLMPVNKSGIFPPVAIAAA